MCGIAGFLGPYDLARLEAMTTAIAHRGPDDSGHVMLETGQAGGYVGLGHRRLSIIDLAGGHQPMWSVDQRSVIVFNGEIYNYRELRRRLEMDGCRFATQSDTEVILQAYERWGDAAVNQLEGMFAFGLWDAARHCWFLARDRFGIKPLYWCQPQPGAFAFASEIKPLLPLLGSTRVERRAFYHYLLYGWSAAEETIFRGVYQLLPGHTLTLGVGEARPSRRGYWRLARRGEERSPAAWTEAVRDALDAAVRSHLVADVPVGLTLSGGLDSSAVLSAMARHAPAERIHALTLGYGLPDDEIPFARVAATHIGVRLSERLVPTDSFANSFAACVWHLEEPLAHPVIGTTFELARFVREKLKVVLIGEGSDELFAGYPEYRLFSFPFRLVPRSLLWRNFLAVVSVLPAAATLARLLVPSEVDGPLLDAAAHVYDGYARTASLGDGALQFELETELTYNQLARIDKLTMAHSVEARVPFLDRAFAELAYDVPLSLKTEGGRGKALLRRAMAERLPPEIVYRPKTGKGGTQALLPTLMQTVTQGKLSHLISRESLANRGWFDPKAVARYLGEAHHPLVRYHPIESRRRAKFALALAVLEQWARLYLDNDHTGLDHD
jgi:asparagine synthase (glutamine-hydrolysing)